MPMPKYRSEAQYAARFTPNGKTHVIRDGWSYARISDARTTCGRKGPFGVEHYASGRTTTITCRACGGGE